MKKKGPVCPHCGTRLSFSQAFDAKDCETYFCETCSNRSKVNFNWDIKKWSIVLITAVCVIALFFSVIVRLYLVGTAVILLLFILFYLQVPKFLTLSNFDEDS